MLLACIPYGSVSDLDGIRWLFLYWLQLLAVLLASESGTDLAQRRVPPHADDPREENPEKIPAGGGSPGFMGAISYGGPTCRLAGSEHT